MRSLNEVQRAHDEIGRLLDLHQRKGTPFAPMLLMQMEVLCWVLEHHAEFGLFVTAYDASAATRAAKRRAEKHPEREARHAQS